MSFKRILIIGSGSIAKRHLSLLKNLIPSSDIRVLFHSKRSEILEMSDGSFYKEKDALNYNPNLVVIANPSTFHIKSAISFAKKNISIFIEKPISASRDDVNELINFCKINNVFITVGYNMRFLESLSYFRDLLSNKFIGKVLSVRSEVGQYLPDWRPNMDYRKSVTANKKLGGGVLLELSHEIDYLRWIFGEVKWTSAFISKQSNLEIDVEDNAHVLLGFNNFLDNRPFVANINMDFIRRDKSRNCTVIGEEGSLYWDATTGKIESFMKSEKKWALVKDFNRDELNLSYKKQWLDIIDSVNNKTESKITIYDALKTLEVIISAHTSSKNSCKIEILNY